MHSTDPATFLNLSQESATGPTSTVESAIIRSGQQLVSKNSRKNLLYQNFEENKTLANQRLRAENGSNGKLSPHRALNDKLLATNESSQNFNSTQGALGERRNILNQHITAQDSRNQFLSSAAIQMQPTPQKQLYNSHSHKRRPSLTNQHGPKASINTHSRQDLKDLLPKSLDKRPSRGDLIQKRTPFDPDRAYKPSSLGPEHTAGYLRAIEKARVQKKRSQNWVEEGPPTRLRNLGGQNAEEIIRQHQAR